MTATAVREVGLPWFERHAVRGGKEIFFFDGTARGSIWEDATAMATFYRLNRDAVKGHIPVWPYTVPGFVTYLPDFDTWEAAEAWLMAP